MANTLAYCAKDFITAVKSFTEQANLIHQVKKKAAKDFSQRLANEGTYSQHFTFFISYEWAH
jgi:hypothetical protein